MTTLFNLTFNEILYSSCIGFYIGVCFNLSEKVFPQLFLANSKIMQREIKTYFDRLNQIYGISWNCLFSMMFVLFGPLFSIVFIAIALLLELIDIIMSKIFIKINIKNLVYS